MPRRDLEGDPDDYETYGEYLRARLDRIRRDYNAGLLLTAKDYHALVDEEENCYGPDYEDDKLTTLRGGYLAQVKRLENGQFYWHLYRGERRVNGGLSENWLSAMRAARSGVAQNNRSNYL